MEGIVQWVLWALGTGHLALVCNDESRTPKHEDEDMSKRDSAPLPQDPWVYAENNVWGEFNC